MTARKKCIELAKMIAKKRDGFICQKCGRASGEVQIQGSHIIPVRAGGLIAGDPRNIIALCAGCHKWNGDSWHESPKQQEWFDIKYPGLADQLKSEMTSRPIKKWEWEAQLLYLKELQKK